ncbi:MAG: RNA polymerase sigma factor [Gemmatimonadaceae bacterium]
MQETIARLLARLRDCKIADACELTPIAYGIARHVIIDIQRRRAREHSQIIEAQSAAPHPLDVLVREEDCARVRIALRALSARDRTLLRRCFMHGESIGKIAADLGEPAERMRKRKSRALQRLAELINGRSRPARHERRVVAIEQV